MGNNNQFPQGFLFGAATSAYQIEGAAFEDGRGKTYWDTANRDEHGMPTGDVGDIACDHYHRYVEDVQLMKKLGLQVYRFSISWVRIFPHGHGDINQAGVDFYDRLLDELDRVGIIPAVTIWHGDLPLDDDQIGGWTNPLVIEHYLEYAQFLFSHFGKRVKLWFTHNEPWCAAFLGDAPMNDKLMVAHHLLVAHAKCVRLYRHMFPNTGEIGIVLNLSKQYPATKNPEDQLAAQYVDGFLNRWFLDPIFKGSYPQDMVTLYASQGYLIPGSPADFELLRNNPGDFLGINMYSRGIQRYEPSNTFLYSADVRNDTATYSDMGWEVCPESLYDLLMDLKQHYGMPIWITENGGAFPDKLEKNGVIQDDDRLQYLRGHLHSVQKAIENQVDVRGYCVWSLFDNFEWGLGYSKRFGIIRVDYETLQRSWKKSAYFYQKVCLTRSIPMKAEE